MIEWLKEVADRADLLEKGVFIGKDKFRARGYLGSGGIGRFRDSLWAVAIGKHRFTKKIRPETIRGWAEKNQATVSRDLQKE